MVSNISPVFAQLVAASPPGDRVLAPIALYDVLNTVFRSVHDLMKPGNRVDTARWVDNARLCLVTAMKDRPDSIKSAIPEALAMMLGVDAVLFPKPARPETMGPSSPLRWSQDLDRVLGYFVAHTVINSKDPVAKTGQGGRPDHPAPALAV